MAVPLVELARSLGELGQEGEKPGEGYCRALGGLDLNALARDEACDRAEHRDPMVAVRVDAAAARAGRRPAHDEAIGLRLDADADAAQTVDDGLDPIRLLCAQLLGAAHDRRPPRERAEER